MTSGNFKLFIIKMRLCSLYTKWEHIPWAMLTDRALLDYDYSLKNSRNPLVWQLFGLGEHGSATKALWFLLAP